MGQKATIPMTYIIATNDDGVSAPGLLALASAMRALGEVNVIAPSQNQSASGHKKTLFSPIRVQQTSLADGSAAVAVGGSPADCVALAALGALRWPPRLVVSGINRGPNVGQDITYSGTVSAAFEATIQGVPAIAFSLDKRDADTPADYAAAAHTAVQIAARALTKPLPQFTVLNVNFPRQAPYRGIRITRQGVRVYRDAPEIDGEMWSIMGDEPSGLVEEEGTDLWAVHQGYVSVTPIHLDLTAHRFLAELAAWDLQL
jgi:5'-nucleotidase